MVNCEWDVEIKRLIKASTEYLKLFLQGLFYSQLTIHNSQYEIHTNHS